MPQSLDDLAADPEAQALIERLKVKGQAELTNEERKARQRSLDSLEVPHFLQVLADNGVSPLKRVPIEIFQLNIGLYCNQVPPTP